MLERVGKTVNRIVSLLGDAAISAVSHDQSGLMTVFIIHSVGNNRSNESVALSPRRFVSLIEFLKEIGVTFVSLENAVSIIRDKEPGKFVALTFDDGHHDFVEFAMPIIAKYRIPVAFSILPHYATNQLPFEFYGSSVTRSLSWDEINMIQDRLANVTIVNHSYRHDNFINLSETELIHDIELSQALIHEHCDVKPKFFAYPFGARTDASDRVVSRYFQHTLLSGPVGQNPGGNSTKFLNRTAIHGTDTLASVRLKVNGMRTAKARLRSLIKPNR